MKKSQFVIEIIFTVVLVVILAGVVKFAFGLYHDSAFQAGYQKALHDMSSTAFVEKK